MKRGTLLSALFVIALITFDITVSISHAKTKTTIYKVTKVSTGSTLRLRAWPSLKSRIKKSLPFNAKDITETGKSKRVGRTKWIEVRWKDNRGWVNKSYLKKTGVLLLNPYKKPSLTKNIFSTKPKPKSRNKVFIYKPSSSKKGKISSRNTRSIKPTNINNLRQVEPSETQMEVPPKEFGGDRYDQTIESRAKEVKTSYSPNNAIKKRINKRLRCSSNTQNPWNMNLNIQGSSIHISFPNQKTLQVPLRYKEWTSASKTRMSLGGSRGRNLVVDINLERSNACRSAATGSRYEIKATINNTFYSGCCH